MTPTTDAHLVLFDRMLESGDVLEHEVVELGVWDEGIAILDPPHNELRSQMWTQVWAGGSGVWSRTWAVGWIGSWGTERVFWRGDLASRTRMWANGVDDSRVGVGRQQATIVWSWRVRDT